MNDAVERALVRLAMLLEQHVGRLRSRGRTRATDPIGGLAIEVGEPERIVAEIARPPAMSAAVPGALALSAGIEGFDRATRQFGLSTYERDALLVALAPEVDDRFGRLFGFVNDSVVAFRPTVGLVASLLAPGLGIADRLRIFLPGSSLLRFGLVELEGDGPLAGRPIRIAAAAWPRLAGLDTPDLPATTVAERLDDLVLDPATRDHVASAAAWLATRITDGVVIVRGSAGIGREAVARAIAGGAGLAAVRFADRAGIPWPTAQAIARDARWHAAAAVVVDPPAEIAATLLDASVPLVVISERIGALASSTRPTWLVELGDLDRARRLELWRRAAPDLDDTARTTLSDRYRLGPARLDEVLRRARELARGAAITPANLHAAAAVTSALRVDGLAARESTTNNLADMVIPAATRRELDVGLAWARRRAGSFTGSGAGGHLGLAGGLVCLFCGPPGTGKTMAARVLAREAGVDLYRVDLANIVSKYIGETEKQLATLLDEAERSDVAIFFDEADALFGKRTAIRDAHDRYANIETGFLLQRLESTTAIVVLASNMRNNLDAAFLRRMHVVADFPVPEPAERRVLWERMLPRASREIDVDLLARFPLAGGEIRNVVATAIVTAPADAAMPHLVWSVCRELAKAGRMLDAGEFGAWQHVAVAFARGGELPA